MKKHFIILLLLLASITAQSQRAHFQGKAFDNGVPVSGTHNIEFSIPSLNWKSPIKTVNVKNGLYSTIINYPANLFDDNNDSREMIVIFDNIALDTVTVFAPLERDPNLKDSIRWTHIHDKPALDMSDTNEIQRMDIVGDTLKLSKGNYVLIPGLSSIKTITMNGSFMIIDTSTRSSVSVSGGGASACNGNANDPVWQSFKATENGKLRQITLPVAASCNNYVVVHIYKGEGDGGQSLGFKSFPVTSTLTTQILDFSSGVNSSANGYISLVNGEVYTFRITPPAGCYVSVMCNINNPYTDGKAYITGTTGNTTDIAFSIGTDHSTPSNFSINSKGYVGIGVDSATAHLEVKGRIKDQSGWISPVGAIMPFAGDQVPEGWLLCDGSEVSRTLYPDLFAEIKTHWGSGNNTSTFNLPDFRGMFLRGVDNSPTRGTAGRDPDRNSRTSINTGGNIGNTIGSIQGEATKQHSHQIQAQGNAFGRNGIVPPWGFYSSSGDVIGAYGPVLNTLPSTALGNETRPQNSYVNYIIKY